MDDAVRFDNRNMVQNNNHAWSVNQESVDLNSYLYADKNVYILLPRDFVRKLLKLDNSTLTPSEQFSKEELEVLRKFSMRKYVKKNKVAGKFFYHDLNAETRKLLLKGIRNI